PTEWNRIEQKQCDQRNDRDALNRAQSPFNAHCRLFRPPLRVHRDVDDRFYHHQDKDKTEKPAGHPRGPRISRQAYPIDFEDNPATHKDTKELSGPISIVIVIPTVASPSNREANQVLKQDE